MDDRKRGPYETSCMAALSLQPEADVERARLTAIAYAKFADSEAGINKKLPAPMPTVDQAIAALRAQSCNGMSDGHVVALIEILQEQLSSVEDGQAFRFLGSQGKGNAEMCRDVADLLADSAHEEVKPSYDEAVPMRPTVFQSMGLAADYAANTFLRSPL